MSYLVIGRPLSQATEREGGELSGAALALGSTAGGSNYGPDWTGFGSRRTCRLPATVVIATALVAGKQINSRLYARYAYGVFSRLGTLLLRYRMSRTLTLEAGAGENQSIDVLYSIEK